MEEYLGNPRFLPEISRNQEPYDEHQELIHCAKKKLADHGELLFLGVLNSLEVFRALNFRRNGKSSKSKELTPDFSAL